MLIDAFVIFFLAFMSCLKLLFAANYNLPTVVDLLLMLYVFA